MGILDDVFDGKDKYKTVNVDKYIEFDLGALMATDSNKLDEQALRRTKEDYMKALARDNTQLLFNQLFSLETQKLDESIVAKLPKRRFRLPRFKPIPKPKPPTKWQQFAKEKGIEKKKKSKLSWDEQLQKWVPIYGFKRAKAENDKNWVLEVPRNADPMEDQFAKKIDAKGERVAKNELQRLRNIAKARKIKVPRFGVTNPDVSSVKDLQTAVTVAKASTASLGKFQDRLPKEKVARGVAAITPGVGRKRKLPPVSSEQEKNETLNIVDSVLNKRPKLNVDKAVARQIDQENTTRSRDKTNRKRNTKSKKPKNAQKGQRKGGGKTAGGRKRR